jgi:hypothetical protein
MNYYAVSVDLSRDVIAFSCPNRQFLVAGQMCFVARLNHQLEHRLLAGVAGKILQPAASG